MKTRAERLLKKLEDLQFDIYHFGGILEESIRNRNNVAEMICESGFELDAAINKMKKAIELI